MRKLKLRLWVKVVLAYLIIAFITYLITIRIDYLANLGF